MAHFWKRFPSRSVASPGQSTEGWNGSQLFESTPARCGRRMLKAAASSDSTWTCPVPLPSVGLNFSAGDTQSEGQWPDCAQLEWLVSRWWNEDRLPALVPGLGGKNPRALQGAALPLPGACHSSSSTRHSEQLMSDGEQAALWSKLYAFPCSSYCSAQCVRGAFDFTLKLALLTGAKDRD